MIQKIIRQLPETIKVDTKSGSNNSPYPKTHESSLHIDVEMKDFYITFWCDVSLVISGYIPSPDPETAPEYPEIEESNIEIRDLFAWCYGDEWTLSRKEEEKLARVIKGKLEVK